MKHKNNNKIVLLAKLCVKMTCTLVIKYLHFFQGLYAETLMTKEEFMEMFDGSLYLKVRKSLPLCEEAFPEVYDKVSKLGRK